jgi:hypothetical protein
MRAFCKRNALLCGRTGVGRAGRVMLRFMDTNADGRIDKEEWCEKRTFRAIYI